jgi:hypothetical protein
MVSNMITVGTLPLRRSEHTVTLGGGRRIFRQSTNFSQDDNMVGQVRLRARLAATHPAVAPCCREFTKERRPRIAPIQTSGATG